MHRPSPKIRLRYLMATVPIALLLFGWAAMTITTASAQSNAPSPITVTGTGTIAANTTNITTFIPAPGSTSANSFLSCTGTTSTPTRINAPYLVTQTGPATINGVVTSITPGSDNTTSVNDPCAPNAISSGFNQVHSVYTYPSVTVQLLNGQSVTGGLIVTNDGTGTFFTAGATTTLGNVTGGAFGSVIGTGALTGVTGTLTKTSVVIVTASSISVSSVYWVTLQIPASLLSSINVATTNTAGAAINGYYTTLWQSGTKIGSCYSPCSFTVINGQSYQVAVSNYSGETFSHWSDSSTTNPRTVSVPGTSGTISLRAVYSP
jgi:hypothetical protein